MKATTLLAVLALSACSSDLGDDDANNGGTGGSGIVIGSGGSGNSGSGTANGQGGSNLGTCGPVQFDGCVGECTAKADACAKGCGDCGGGARTK